MSDAKKENDEKDRREFFRLDDKVNLSFKCLTEDEMSNGVKELAFGLTDSLTIMTRMSSITQQLSASLHRIDQRDPDTADYLRALDEKIEILAQTYISKNSDLVEQPTQVVNLSAGGIAFEVEEPVTLQIPLEVKLLLFPTYTGILIYGRVISCDASKEGGYQIRVDFEFIRDNDRDALIRHILRKQGESLRRIREEREAE
ncbi:MAG: PilZ domain-containing protein [Candidatus Polarisedimenticolaceae bacterium]|nr:PilZ domain-containing protein [Candidatus Polarisedimenticolaceae bacterium]